MSELVKRLRALVIIDEVRSDNKLGQDAAARILELEAENTKLREALGPFGSLSPFNTYCNDVDSPWIVQEKMHLACGILF